MIEKEFLWTDGETVYNLGVAEDNSYFANGIAVHNCDLWAGHDEGLGEGNYSDAGSVPTEHPHGLCFTISVLKDFPEVSVPGKKPNVADVPESQVRYYAAQGDAAATARLRLLESED